jgi:putative tricarboxylic transport membrane protein
MTSAILGAATLFVAAVYGLGILQIPARVFGDPLGPRVFPLLLLGSLILVAVLLFVEAAKSEAWKGRAAAFVVFARTDLRVVAAAAASLLLFYVAFQPVGYFLSSAVFLTGMMLFFYKGRRWISIVTALSFSLVSYLLFARLFEVPLPTGLSPI